ncbi:MAG: TonB-dependent receptor [Gammaproteobacteria bacterium]|nr:TonB-dependent receptor [Gammaproteobacteria bacterium]
MNRSFDNLQTQRFYKLPLSLTLLATLSTLSPASLLAAEDDLFFDMPVVLSANRLEQSINDAAVSITVIDRETIEASGARYIPELLRLIPGMQVGFSGNEFGSEPIYVVAYHGLSDEYSKQMQVLIDGRSIYEPFIGGINWKAIPVNINDIERIEVSRGPNLATYGSNSFQAAINIITRTAAEDQGSFVQSNLGSNNIADLTYRYGGSNGNLDYRITASSYNDAGLDSANEFNYPDDTHSNNIDYRLDYQLDNKNLISYQGGFGRNRQGADRNHDGLLPTVRTVENNSLFQFIKWENSIDENNTLQIQYYYNLTNKEDFSQSELIVFGPPIDSFTLDINNDIKTQRHNLELTHFTAPNANLKFSWGLSAQIDAVNAPYYLGNNKDVTNKQFRGFANIEWHIDQKNIINFGGLAEKNDFTKTEFSPRLSFTHAFNRHHSIRLGISQAIRSPFIYEAKANQFLTHDVTSGGVPTGTLHEQQFLGGIIADTNLKNEKIISREIVYFGNFLDASLLFNARLFHDDITEIIDTSRLDVAAFTPADNVPNDLSQFGNPAAVNTVRVFDNLDRSTATGLELELDYRIDKTLRLLASGAIINITSNDSPLINSAPQHSFSFITTKRFNEKYNGSLSYYYVDAFKWTDSRSFTEAYETVDIRLSRKVTFNTSKGSVSVVVKNLLNDYSDYQKTPSNSSAPNVIYTTLAYIDLRLTF